MSTWVAHVQWPINTGDGRYLGEQEARTLADRQGITLVGEPTVTEELLAWVEGWTDEGGAYVALGMARMIDPDAKPNAVLYRFAWDLTE